MFIESVSEVKDDLGRCYAFKNWLGVIEIHGSDKFFGSRPGT